MYFANVSKVAPTLSIPRRGKITCEQVLEALDIFEITQREPRRGWFVSSDTDAGETFCGLARRASSVAAFRSRSSMVLL